MDKTGDNINVSDKMEIEVKETTDNLIDDGPLGAANRDILANCVMFNLCKIISTCSPEGTVITLPKERSERILKAMVELKKKDCRLPYYYPQLVTLNEIEDFLGKNQSTQKDLLDSFVKGGGESAHSNHSLRWDVNDQSKEFSIRMYREVVG